MEHSIFFPCFIQCVAVEQEGKVLIEKFEVKGEMLDEFPGGPLPTVFIGGQSAWSPCEGMEYIASVPLPGQCWHIHQGQEDRLSTLSGLLSPVEEFGLDLKLTNQSQYDNEIVVMATGDTNGQVRNFFVRVPANETYSVCLDPLRDYDDLHLISWQPFDASLEIDDGSSNKELMSITVQAPKLHRYNHQKYTDYCQERFTYKRFSGSYLFGYFERVVAGEHLGEVSLHLFWPNHGEILHARYLCGENLEQRSPVMVSPEALETWFGAPPTFLPGEVEPTVYLVSDMSGSSFFTEERTELHSKAVVSV